MAGIKKKVSFYLLTQDQKREDDSKSCISNGDVGKNFEYIYDKMPKLKDGTAVARLINGNDRFVVEIVSYNREENTVFLKIGHQNYSNTVLLRDQNTLETAEVPMSDSQRLELFTYCYIDFQTCIVSHIRLNGAPGISSLRYFFNDFLLKDKNVITSISTIVSSDIIEKLMTKKVSKVSISVAVPGDAILSGEIGIGKTQFSNLQNIKKVEHTISISGKRFKNIFSTPSRFTQFISDTKIEHGSNLTGLHVNAKSEGEDSEVYNILNYNFTKSVTFDVDSIADLSPEDFETEMIRIYNMNKADLKEYIPSES